MILLLVLICITYHGCEGKAWIHPFPGFPSVLGNPGKLCRPDKLRTKPIPAVPVQDGEPVYLNLYDLSIRLKSVKLKRITDSLLVIYHSGVQVYGTEYSFFPYNPKTGGGGIVELPAEMVQNGTENFKFQKSILLGYTDLTQEKVERYVTTLRKLGFTGDKYNLITRNCNVFSNSLTEMLIGKSIPSQLNRPAFIARCLRIQRMIPKRWIPNKFQYHFN